MEEMAYIDPICNKKRSLYIHQTVPVISSKWYVKLSRYGRHLTIAHALLTNSESYVVND